MDFGKPAARRDSSRQVAGRDVLIVVEDTSPGIQEENPVRIFDPMFSNLAQKRT